MSNKQKIFIIGHPVVTNKNTYCKGLIINYIIFFGALLYPPPPPLSSSIIFWLTPPTPYRDDVIYEHDISKEIYDHFGWELNLLGSRSL